MVLSFGEINTEEDGSGTSINLGDVTVYVTMLANNNFGKNLPLTIPSERLNINLFGAFRRIRIIGTITGADVATFLTLINAWFNERKSVGRYIRGRVDSTPLRIIIESAQIPEIHPTDIIHNYELVLIQGIN